MKYKVLLTQKFLPAAIKRLETTYDLVIVEGSGRSLKEALKDHPDAVALVSFLSDPIDMDVIDHGRNLKLIANFAVGYNNIDVRYALERGIYVSHTPDVLTDATADLTMALILAVSRRIVEADNFLRTDRFKGWDANLLLGREMKGSTLGIVGLGRIGTALAIRARSFGLKIIYSEKEQKTDLERKYGFEYVEFLDLLEYADIVSLHIPYSQEVHHLMDSHHFDLMKRDAIFINVSRGPLMDEAYLAEKLEHKELFGAGLDVYEFEPRVTKKLKSLSNCVLVPHIGSATEQTRLAMAYLAIDSVDEVLGGQIPANLVPEWKEYLTEL